jgi:hypothetical protein
VNVAATIAKPVAALAWPREENEWYVENRWCSRRLFEEEPFDGAILDPCAGSGRIVESARAAGYVARGCDVVDRGFDYYAVCDFLTSGITADNIVMNQPFDLSEAFARQAMRRASRKVAMIMPTRRLNAAGAWIKELPLYRLWYLTPRPSMPPGSLALDYEAKGKEPSGGKQDFCWLVFLKGYDGKAEVRWLHRDKSKQA